MENEFKKSPVVVNLCYKYARSSFSYFVDELVYLYKVKNEIVNGNY